MQLFAEGLGAVCHEVDTYSSDSSNDLDAIPLPDADVQYVHIPSNRFVPCSQLLGDLSAINPVAHCTDFGREFYKRAILLAGEHMPCSSCQLQ